MQCVWILKDKLHSTMSAATHVQWIGSSCGRHGSYTFYKGFKIESDGVEKSYCLGEFYFVRNSEDRPICIAELQLIWHEASTDSKLASARLYFRPENTPFGRQSMHGKDELLYADQKVIIKCDDMLQWEYSGCAWTTGSIPPLEQDFVAVQETCTNIFTGKPENKYRLQNTSSQKETFSNTPSEKIIILTFQAYCRFNALKKKLLGGMTIAKSQLAALGGFLAAKKSTRVVFCRQCFSCPDLDQFHLSGENKAPVLKGRPRKKKIRNSTLAKELKRKRFLADLERVKENLPTKKIKISESEEGTESDLSEESTKSCESMDEERVHYTVETPVEKKQPPNGLLPVSIKQVVKVMSTDGKEFRSNVPPPLIPTVKVKTIPTSPPPFKVKVKPDAPLVLKVDGGPPPLYPLSQRTESHIKTGTQSVPRLLPHSDVCDSTKTQQESMMPLSSSQAYTVIKTSGAAVSTTCPDTCSSSPMIFPKSVEPLGNAVSKALTKVQLSDELGVVKVEGKENLQDRKKVKKKRLRQPGSMKEVNEDFADEDEKYFMRSLREFMKSRDTPICKIPALGFKRVNLWTMYSTSQKLGGYDMVTSKRLWRQVYDALGGSTTITSAATYTRRHYERLLLPYERFARGQLNAKKGVPQTPNSSNGQDTPSIPKEKLTQPINNGHTRESDTKIARDNHSQSGTAKTSRDDNNQSGTAIVTTSRDNNNQFGTTAMRISRDDNNQSGTVKTSCDNNNQPGTAIVTTSRDSNIQSCIAIVETSRDNNNQSGTSIVKTSRDNNNQSATTAVKSSRDNNSQSGITVIKMSRDINSQSCTNSSIRMNSNERQHDNTQLIVVKVKPNGALPPYSVSVQKECSKPTSSVIVTKSINVPVSSVAHSSRSNAPNDPLQTTAPILCSKPKTSVTPNLIYKPSSVTANSLSRQTVTVPASPRAVVTTSTGKTPTSTTYLLPDTKGVARTTTPRAPQNKLALTTVKEFVLHKQSSQGNSKDYRRQSVNPMVRTSHPVSTDGGHQRNTESNQERRVRELASPKLERELNQGQERIQHHHSNIHDQQNSLLYDVITPSAQQTNKKAGIKRSIPVGQIAEDSMQGNTPDKDTYFGMQFSHDTNCRNISLEPLAKRRKSPSPALMKVTTSQQPIISHSNAMISRNIGHYPRMLASDSHATLHHTGVSIGGHTPGQILPTYNDGSQAHERKIHSEPSSARKPVFVEQGKQHLTITQRKDTVDLTESKAMAYPHRRRSESLLSSKISHQHLQEYEVDSCQRTEPRLPGNSHRSAQRNHLEDACQHNIKLNEEVPISMEYPHNVKHEKTVPVSMEYPHSIKHENLVPGPEYEQMTAEIPRTIMQRTFIESPDDHFQEWRRRQGITQYPAYITENPNEPRRRPSVNDPLLHSHTPPLEPRYMYVQDENGMHPRVIEEVPLILSSKPGLYYQDESFYGGVPFYHGGWTTAGVADGMTFKGEPDNIHSNNHLRSSSCIFMPTSQMFGSVPIAPLSPPGMMNQGHVVTGPADSVGIHPHCIISPQYPHNHQMVSMATTPTRPLHSYT